MLSQGPSLQMKYMFGLKAGNPQVFHVDEHKVVYPAGHNIITYNIEDKLMQYYPSLENTTAITCVAISPQRRYLAVAENAEKAVCIIYDTQTQRRKKTLSNPDCESEEYVAMAFAPGHEHKYLVTVSGGPDWMLTYW
jgi:WD40 repeat protein